MKKLKWFWIINYAITIYAFTLLLIEVFSLPNDGSFVKSSINNIENILSFNGTISIIPLLCIEWLQIPLILGVLICKKAERTTWHWLYWFFLIFLALIKIIFYFSAAIGFARGEA